MRLLVNRISRPRCVLLPRRISGCCREYALAACVGSGLLHLLPQENAVPTAIGDVPPLQHGVCIMGFKSIRADTLHCIVIP
jgi:hypothetical protein